MILSNWELKATILCWGPTGTGPDSVAEGDNKTGQGHAAQKKQIQQW